MATRDPTRRAAQDLTGLLADLFEAHAIDPLLGEVWVELLLSPAARDAADVAAALDLGEDEAAAALAELLDLGAARQAQGGFSAEVDLLTVASRFVRARQLPLVEEAEEAVRHARDLLAAGSAGAAPAARARLDALVRQVALVRRLLAAFADRGGRDLEQLLRALQG